MKQIYILPLLLLISLRMLAQPCSSLNFTYVTAESRCMATGSITVNVTGGSGSYNFKVTGPISPSVTSSNVITGLPTGYYSIQVTDLTSGCTLQKDSAFVSGSYSDPRFLLAETDVSCAGNDGTVSVQNLQFGRSPFSYTIIAPSPGSVGQTSPTGIFSSLVPGEYFIQLTDSCGGIQVRRITVQNYSWSINSVNATKIGCDSANVNITLIDNKGNTNTNSPAFNGFTYGVVSSPGDTAWSPVSSFHAYNGTNKNLNVVVKDKCGNIHSSLFYFPPGALPSIGPISMTNFTCTTFTASVTGGQNLTNPGYCLLDSAGNYFECSATSGIFSNIPYGRYCVQVTNGCNDTTITSCFSSYPSTPSVDNTIAISNQACASFTATVSGQSNLRNPYFCLYDSLNNNISCDSTGIFNNLPYGSYCIRITVTCPDSTITRCFTAGKPSPVITNVAFTGITCSTFNVTAQGTNLNNANFCLYDSLGNVISCDSTGIFNGIPQGSYCIKAVTCGDTSAAYCFPGAKPVPLVAPNVQITNKNCTGFTASVTGQSNLTNPLYCLYDTNNVQVSCDSTGVFNNIAYGSYCIKITDGCVDTTISRCFTQLIPIPSISDTIQVTSASCSTFSARVIGTNLTNPQFCLYDSLNNLYACDSTGIFSNIPYGTYCVRVHDGCYDTTIQVCQSFRPAKGISVSTSRSCTIGISTMTVQFNNPNPPYRVQFYHPNGTLMIDTTANVNPVRVTIPALPVGGQYKVIGIDSCGNKDSTLITPDATSVTTNTTVNSKCPSGSFLNGAGDITASSISNLYSLTPLIVQKDGVNTTISYSNQSGNIYTFSDLAPAQYVVEYTMQNCNDKLRDTVTINPYVYPSQGQSAIYQCDNNGFSMNADVSGGVGPYTYQIIGSQPVSPSINTAPQSSPIFNINNGTTYSLVRLRAVDECGNATLNDVSVLPLQNISITASSDCFFQNIVLTTDTIPNAIYTWYQRTSATDSVLIDSGMSYNFPFFQPEQVGQYIVRANVNEGCVTRVAYIDLNGNCNYTPLQVPIQLQGKQTDFGNMLSWSSSGEKNLTAFSVERKSETDNDYHSIGYVMAGTLNQFQFTDSHPQAGKNTYRLKVFFTGKEGYTNSIDLQNSRDMISVYPNPTKDMVHISINTNTPSNYIIEVLGASGQKLYQAMINNTSRMVYDYSFNNSYPPGIYIIKITNLTLGSTVTKKILKN